MADYLNAVFRAFIARSMYWSTYNNPRRLEHLEYPHHLAVAQQCTAGDDDLLHVAAQWPIWLSPKGQPQPQDADTSFGTIADGAAKGLYPDLATLLFHVELHPQANVAHFKAASLYDILWELALDHRTRSRLLRLISVEITTLYELKPGPSRHPSTLEPYYDKLRSLLNTAQRQAQDQALFTLCCVRYASQADIILVAGVGEYWATTRVTRDEAKSQIDNEDELDSLRMRLGLRTDTIGLKKLLEGYQADEDEEDSDESEDDEEADDLSGVALPGQTTRLKAEADAKRRQAQEVRAGKQQEERAERALRRKERQDRAGIATDLGFKEPSFDRNKDVFDDADIDQMSQLRGRGLFFENRPPAEYFSIPHEKHAVRFSLALRYGTPLSDQYLEHIKSVQSAKAARVRQVMKDTPL
ncbi:hypothetical protein C8R46DRAFT_1093645 [Mycena filopes]|nr:hypothetical protein C8R46DRAFT_1093645 [Mycena filopes]